MDGTGGYPKMEYNTTQSNNDLNHDQFLNDATSESSWFGLAISGLKFLLNNQNNNNINQNPQVSFSNPHTTNLASYNPNSNTKHRKKNKLHILGPSVFKKQLYDIPEYQSTASSGSSDKDDNNKTKTRLTAEAIQQLNENFKKNFKNYWNQRSSLHSSHKDDDSIAGSQHTHTTNQSSSQQQQQQQSQQQQQQPSQNQQIPNSNEYAPSLASSLIIHPTQDKPLGMKHSRSFPLLHSAKYMFFENCEMIPPDLSGNAFNIVTNSSEGSQSQSQTSNNDNNDNNVATTPIMILHPQIKANINPHVLFKTNIKNVQSMTSWESINSSIASISNSNFSEYDNNLPNNAKLVDLLNDNHFIEKTNGNTLRQTKWLNKTTSIPLKPINIKSRKSYDNMHNIDVNYKKIQTNYDSSSTNNTTTVLVHVTPKPNSSDIEWTDAKSKALSLHVPKSNKQKPNKLVNKCDDDPVFSDWSNVSSNLSNIPHLK